MPVSNDTMPRLIRAAPLPEAPADRFSPVAVAIAWSLSHCATAGEALHAGKFIMIAGLKDGAGEALLAEMAAEARLAARDAKIRRLTEELAAAIERARTGEASRLLERRAIEASLSWRLVSHLRRIRHDHPFAVRVAVQPARWLLRTMVRKRVAKGRALVAARLRADPDVLAAASLFDAEWYRATYPDIGEAEPLLHYVDHGRMMGYKPNPFFDPAWYVAEHGLADASTALQHFLGRGAAERLDPSPLFSTGFYIDHYRDAIGATNPLAHYLAEGRYAGRSARPTWQEAPPVEDVPIRTLKAPVGGRETALLVTHSKDGSLHAHLQPYIAALRSEGILVTLVVAADNGFVADGLLVEAVDGLFVRGNAGWDFAAWAHVLRLAPVLFGSELLLLLNDSVLGPVSEQAFSVLLRRIRDTNADVVGLTDSQERSVHLQSYFLAFKERALRSVTFTAFVADVRCQPLKEDVINAYEITLSTTMERGGLRTAALFPNPCNGNPTLGRWRELLDEGFPFIKRSVLPQAAGWQDVLAQHGYDLSLAQSAPKQQHSPSGTVTVAHDPAPLVSFIGPFNYDNGLGTAARGFLRGFRHTQLRVNTLPLERPFGVHARVTPDISHIARAGRTDVSVVQVNPEAWHVLISAEQRRLIQSARRTIGSFVWESQLLPESFAERCRHMDAVWVPSRFCADIFRPVSEAPVMVVPYAVAVPDTETVDQAAMAGWRTTLGLNPTQRAVLFSFDATSNLQRKNPHALVRAFADAGLARENWALVLKTKHLSADRPDNVSLSTIAAATPGVVLIDRPLSSRDAAALLDLADIYASPHASEGFGLTIAEAMARGKPVIATNFGGSTDWLDESCGFPVPFRPRELVEDDGPYRRGTIWADIDGDELAATLLRVAALTQDAGTMLASQARARIAGRLSPQVVGALMEASILDVLAA